MKPTLAGSTPSKVVFALIFVQFLFGINYLTSKVIVDALPPILWANFRLIVASLALFGLAYFSGRKRPQIDKEFIRSLFINGTLGFCISQAAFLGGLRYTTSTNSAILNSLIPIFTLLFASLLGFEPFTFRRVLGFIIAMLGVLVIWNVEDFSFSKGTFYGDVLTILNCISTGLFLVLSKKLVSKHDPIWITASLLFVGAIGLSILSFPQFQSFSMPQEFGTTLIACMAFSIIGATFFAYLINLWALRQTHSSQVAFFGNLQPLIACFFAYFLMGQPLSWRTFLSIGMIFLGMVLSVRPKQNCSG